MSGDRHGDSEGRRESEGDARARQTRAKWNARYAFSGDSVPPPAEVLGRGVRWLPGNTEAARTSGGASDSSDRTPRALDLACGRAGNGEWLAARGFRVSAWDVSARAIESIRARPDSGIAEATVRDVLARPPEPDSFDVIVVARFLERTLCPAIARALRPGGVLFYQTFTRGLSNPDYLLGPNELLDLFPTLGICRYHEPSPPMLPPSPPGGVTPTSRPGGDTRVAIEAARPGADRIGEGRAEAMLVARRIV